MASLTSVFKKRPTPRSGSPNDDSSVSPEPDTPTTTSTPPVATGAAPLSSVPTSASNTTTSTMLTSSTTPTGSIPAVLDPVDPVHPSSTHSASQKVHTQPQATSPVLPFRRSSLLAKLRPPIPGHSSPTTASTPITAQAAQESPLSPSPSGHSRRWSGDHRNVFAKMPGISNRTMRKIMPFYGSGAESDEMPSSRDSVESTERPAFVTSSHVRPPRYRKNQSGVSSEQADQGRLIRAERRRSRKERRATRHATKREKLATERAKREAHQLERRNDKGIVQVDQEDNPILIFRVKPMNSYSGERRLPPLQEEPISAFSASRIGQRVWFRARVHVIRPLSKNLLFVVVRQEHVTAQVVLRIQPVGRIATTTGDPIGPASSDIAQTKVRAWTRSFLVPETVVEIDGVLAAPNSGSGRVNTTIQDVEVVPSVISVVSLVERLPFSVNQAEKSNRWRRVEEKKDGKRRRNGDPNLTSGSTQSDLSVIAKEKEPGRPQVAVVSESSRTQNRVIDLRTEASSSIFRIQSAVSQAFRNHLVSLGFIEIHTPKLQGAATESGASVFRVDYFGRPAFLAQSPQLAKQLAIAADMKRVFEIGPVFRAENSNTHRHLTEFTGLDLEMQITEHYHEVLDVLDSTFKAIFTAVYSTCRSELDAVKRRFPHQDIVWLDVTPRIRFSDAIEMLNQSGWRSEEGELLKVDEDLSTRDEIQLGKLMKAKYNTDYYIIDKFPVQARPFYAMPDPDDPSVTNSFDIFLRGQEILSGGQRIHDAYFLRKRMAASTIDVDGGMAEYMSGFEFGAPPHGGGGIGLERLLFLLLDTDDIRRETMFHRDPRSFPFKLTEGSELLRYPQADTRSPSWDTTKGEVAEAVYPSLEKLIANYGDATNTSWLEPRTKIWRHTRTGAVVGYVPMESHVIIAGNPLCHESQYEIVTTAFLDFVDQSGMKPIWILVNKQMEGVLAKRKWRTLSATAEQRLDPTDPVRLYSKHVVRKLQQTKGRIKMVDYDFGQELPPNVNAQLVEKVAAWHQSRADRKQVHLTEIRTDQDMTHRSTHLAYSVETGEIVAMVMLAQLAPRYGVQVKYSLDFPGSCSGTIEALLVHAFEFVARNQERITLASPTARAIEAARASSRSQNDDDGPGSGSTSPLASRNLCVTFGSGANSRLEIGHHISFPRSMFLTVMYNNVVKAAGLTNKSVFRRKLGTVEDPTWVCYPHRGLSYPAVVKLLKFFGYEWDIANKALKIDFGFKALRRFHED